jgi:hypothetical protein
VARRVLAAAIDTTLLSGSGSANGSVTGKPCRIRSAAAPM